MPPNQTSAARAAPAPAVSSPPPLLEEAPGHRTWGPALRLLCLVCRQAPPKQRPKERTASWLCSTIRTATSPPRRTSSSRPCKAPGTRTRTAARSSTTPWQRHKAAFLPFLLCLSARLLQARRQLQQLLRRQQPRRRRGRRLKIGLLPHERARLQSLRPLRLRLEPGLRPSARRRTRRKRRGSARRRQRRSRRV